ncbi:peptidoglycan-binding protein LysM [Sabulicella rubraurantiaca]|uniref:peptidoglycan-binding protein LysM n=1 Tax=Sabulicella rubraurantiaca TaxID=2811429 RepID=UPI001A9620AD|nr:peptidoglycan-binding protein LysM [Sabulicella rubraurantiaca]
MGLFNFIQGVGRRLGLGTTATAAEAEKEPAPTPPSADMLQQEVNRLGLNAAGVTMKVEEGTVVLEGARGMDPAEHEKLVLALGNVAGISAVDDRTQGAPQPEATFYTVKKGDTLSAIAKAHLGNANAYMKIFEANTPMLEHPDRIYPGQVLRIPKD